MESTDVNKKSAKPSLLNRLIVSCRRMVEVSKRYLTPDNLIKSSIFLVSALVVAFVPIEQGGRDRIYSYSVGEPWANRNFTSSFGFDVMPDSAHVADSINEHYNKYPVYASVGGIGASVNDSISRIDLFQKYYSNLLGRISAKITDSYHRGVVSSDVMDDIEAHNADSISVVFSTVVRKVHTSELMTPDQVYDEVKRMARDSLFLATLNECGIESLLAPNIVFDNATIGWLKNREIQRIINAPLRSVKKGEKIIGRGEIVSKDLENVISAHENMLTLSVDDSKREYLLTSLGRFVFAIIMFAGVYFYLSMFRRRIFDRYKSLSCIMLLMVLFFVIGALAAKNNPLALYIVPYVILPIMLAVFFDLRTATFCVVVEALLCSPLSEIPHDFIVMQIVSGVAAIYSLKEFSKRSQLLKAAGMAFLGYVLTYVSIELVVSGSFSSISRTVLFFFGLNAALASTAYILIFVFEKLFGFVSVVTLVELSDINNPLLSKLAEDCPGTFQHSITVSTLARDAAASVNGNVALIRTGALYHDIGKMRNPVFFTENQHGINPHDGLDPRQSAKIVIGHVTDGLAYAEKENLPSMIKRFISEHHGTGQAKYFYNKYCLEHPGEDVDPAPFSYPGPNPQTVESSIMMMADAVEAASRSLPSYTDESISALVNKIIDGQIADGLHNESPISFKDVKAIKEAFVKRLRTIYHSRVAYPEAPKRTGSTQSAVV